MGRVVLGAAIAVMAFAQNAGAGSIAEAGRAVYQDHCASCHGAKSEGAPGWRTPNEQGELPAPPHDSSGHTWRHSDAMLQKMVRQGWRDPFNKTDTMTMPPFGAVLSDAEIRSVIAHLKTLWTAKQRSFQHRESQR